MKLNNEFVFFFSEIPSLQIRPQIIYPSQSATLSTSQQSGGFGEGAPVALAVNPDVVDEARVLFLGPSAFVCVSFLTAR